MMSRCDAVLCPREYGDKTSVPPMILSLSFNESRTSPIVIYDPKSSFAKLFQLHYVCVCFWQSCNLCFEKQNRTTCITYWSKFHCSMNLCEGCSLDYSITTYLTS